MSSQKSFIVHFFNSAPWSSHEVHEYSLGEIEEIFKSRDTRIYTAAEQMGIAETEKFYSDDDNDLVVIHRIR